MTLWHKDCSVLTYVVDLLQTFAYSFEKKKEKDVLVSLKAKVLQTLT